MSTTTPFAPASLTADQIQGIRAQTLAQAEADALQAWLNWARASAALEATKAEFERLIPTPAEVTAEDETTHADSA